jgi:hypothetical protein
MKRNKLGFVLGATLALVIAASLFTGSSPVSAGNYDVSAHWQQVASPNVGTGDNVLNSAYAINSNTVWAVGYYMDKYNHARTLIEYGYLSGSSNGQNIYTWSVVNSPNPSLTDNYLNSVAFTRNAQVPVSPNVAWAVGYYVNTSSSNAYKQALIARYDNSATGGWTNASPKATAYDTVLNAVAGSNTNNYIAVGYYYNTTLGLNQTLAMYWNGSYWSQMVSPNQAGLNSYLTSVSVLDNKTAWAVGYYVDKLQVQHSMLLKWNGTMWKNFTTELPPYAGANLMSGVSLNTANGSAWLVGFDSQKTAPVAYFHDYNGKWVMNSPSVGQLAGVDYIAPMAAWTVGFVATATSTSNRAYFWDGSRWTENTPGTATTIDALLGVSGVSSSDVWAVGWSLRGGQRVTQIQHYN